MKHTHHISIYAIWHRWPVLKSIRFVSVLFINSTVYRNGICISATSNQNDNIKTFNNDTPITVRVHTVFSFFVLHSIKRKTEIKLLHTVFRFLYYLIKIKKRKTISHTVFCFSYNQTKHEIRFFKRNDTLFFISRYEHWKNVGYYLLPITVLKTKNEKRGALRSVPGR